MLPRPDRPRPAPPKNPPPLRALVKLPARALPVRSRCRSSSWLAPPARAQPCRRRPRLGQRRGVVDAPGLNVGEQILQPVAIEAPLPVDVAEQMLAARRQQGDQLLAQRLQLGDERLRAGDPAADGLGQGVAVEPLEKEQGAIENLRDRAVLLELPEHSLAEFGAAFGRDRVDGPHPAARHALLRDGRDRAPPLQLADGIIERADVQIEIAFDHRGLEPAPDLIGMEIAPVEHPEDDEPCLHSLIILIQSDQRYQKREAVMMRMVLAVIGGLVTWLLVATLLDIG